MDRLEFRCQHRYPSGFKLDVAFSAGDGVTALFGPSGSGKTSVLSMIAGLRRPDAGRIALAGRVLFDRDGRIDLPPQRRRIGYVFQQHLLFPHRTVEGNLRYAWRRAPSADHRFEFQRIVDVLELGPLLNRYPATLSGGEAQRVSLGRALLSQPELLLLDEPWSALDDTLKGRILAYIQRIQAELSLPTLLVSHDQAPVRLLAQSVVVLDRGRVVAAGPPDEALSDRVPLGWHDSSRPTNVLRLEEVRQEAGHWTGRVGACWLHLPQLEQPPAGAVYVSFLPGEVTLARAAVAGLSVRNQLPGVVVKIVEAAGGVFVAADIGSVIWAEVTREAATELQLASGAPVVCLIKTQSLRVLS